MPTPAFFAKLCGVLGLVAYPIAVLAQGAQGGIELIEPIGGVTNIPTQGMAGFGVLSVYFNLIYPWVIGMGAGLAVFMGVYGGIIIIQAGADPAEVTRGKNQLMMSLGGLLLLLLSDTILNALNPTFFR